MIRIPDRPKKIIQELQNAGFSAYVVGGSVRDLILGRESPDWDFTTNATPEEIQKIFPESFYENDYGTVGIKIKNDLGETEEIYEVTPFRKESSYFDGRHPSSVKWAKTVEEDLARRDFTINALALTLDGNKPVLLDLYDGQKDINAKLIRAVGNPNDRFSEDALRLMRAVRLASQLAFQIEEDTWTAMKRSVDGLKNISSERIRDELIKILASNYPADGIQLLYNTGLLDLIIPELTAGVGMKQPGHHISDVYTHSVNSLRFCKNPNWLVRFAALIHDIGKPTTYVIRGGKPTFYNHEVVGSRIAKDIANRLHFSKEQRDKLFILVRWHMFSVSELISDAAVRRFIRRIGPENTGDMLDIRIGDRLGSGAKASSWRLERFKERIIEVQKHTPSVRDLKVNGKDIMEVLGIAPGPKIGEILNKLFEEITEDPAKNDREYLVDRIKQLGSL